MSGIFDNALSEGPVHKRAQRLRWFTKAFEDQVAETERDTGNSYSLNQSSLAEVFSKWIEAFNAQKPDTAEARRDYVGFASGLMLRTLIERNPIEAVTRPVDADVEEPVYFWPEGYVYVMFCLKVRGLSQAIAFLDLFAGETPQWAMPSLFSARLGSEKDQSLTLAKPDVPRE